MERQTLNRREYIVLGSLLFGLFFGAGNLIFPIHLGQLAGANWGPATIGFLLSAILLPLLSILAISQTNSASMYDLARPVGQGFASFFLIATHASLGLLIASPRTATVTFEIGVIPFIPKGTEHISLLIFSFLFFLTTFLLSRNQQKITFYVGRLLNPLFLVLLTFIFAWALLIKGDISAVHWSFGHAAPANLINGFLQGYNTMDALAGLTFGVTITSALKFFKLHDRGEQSKAIAKIGLLSLSLEAIVYTLLIMLGAISLNFAKLSDNGGSAFNQIMSHYTGIIGTALLAALTLLACLTTAIGLITSLAQDLSRRFPKLGFTRILLATTAGAFLIANLGLDQIITFSTPILMFLYPLAIALIILGIFDPWIKQRQIIYRVTIIATAIPATLDFIHALPPVFAQWAPFKAINAFALETVPWFNVGLDFIPFMLVGLIVGIALAFLKRTPTA
ncbi:branched-chain amino acid transport system II carrier protein [Furfurilactobacillus siliginis]|uniref:Branched-chain amino acid transport system carrier protein n=1 Tax=Furfurilactobacillus siliginis TaxID=348151 RepID=A0A0R2KX23_9LACO|nr:branched-chain amino acid transport system II carrier protein [Furfurilactobacillus siliginis]KRN93985.1 branched-chain amino acid permease [Furfurilactobacillus siliginis]GEK29223.1 branched-chain amino acid transport system carrier protein [Furfurilactobacillus siliginis]